MLHQREVPVEYLEAFLIQKSVDAVVQAAQGDGGITDPGGVQELWRNDTKGRG